MTTGPTPHGLSFLQHRLSLFGRWGFVIVGSGLLLRVVLALLAGRIDEIGTIDAAGHGGAAAVLLATWLVLRDGARSQDALHAIETASVVLAGGALCVMATGIPAEVHPEYVLLLAMSQTMMLRSVYVPSSARRTALLSAVLGVLQIATAVVLAQSHAAASSPGPFASPLPLAVAVGIWWFFASVVNVLASSVIYGLRRQVHDATQLGQYTLEAKLGEGGMGMVFRAHHALLRRPTAIKLLPPERSGQRTIARFEREVQRTASLAHPNIVTVFDYGRTPSGIFYYAMELLVGLDLDQLVERFGPQPPARVAYVLAQVCDGLAEAHAVGLIHRDIKPANIFLVRHGRIADLAKLVDFGLVKDVESETGLTQENTITGTPQYLSPEAIRGAHDVDARSDLYALGCVAYRLLTGRPVFEGKSVVDICSQHLYDSPVSPSQRLGAPIPAGLESVIMHCLEKRPENRPQSAEALRDALLALFDLVAAWGPTQARAWWDAHPDALDRREHADVSALGTAPTIAVDVRARARLGDRIEPSSAASSQRLR